MERSIINKEVNVNAFYFSQKTNNLRPFPKQIEFDGRHVAFAENGLRYLVQRGAQIIQLFDMNDGRTTYRLRREDNRWTLIGMRAGA